ncbi:MAG TPA: alpha-glucosidase/alpha-galactosidase [Bacillota bacterium]|nr:alpha-glucosidase/alpha-galactosidase [Bacillota bacterium]
MNVVNQRASGIRIAYIGGGSREWAIKLMSDLALEEALSGTVVLYDIDQEAAEENAKMGNALSARAEVKGKWEYQTVDNLDQALQGADFVIISILPGTFQEMASDVHVPEKYGIYQSVGDTSGPGGLMRALRTIPIYVKIAEKIKEIAPEAWVINYTNPMTLCTRVLYEVFPEIKAFGCCHEVFWTQILLADMLRAELGIEGVTREAIKTNVLGLNHFTWITQASYQGIDLMPVYRHFVEKHFAEGYTDPQHGDWESSVFSYANRVKFDLFRRYGAIAAAGDRHLAEFAPLSWYLKDPETVKSWKFNLTTVDYRIKRREEWNRKRKQWVANPAEIPLQPSGEEGVNQIKALLGLGEIVTNVNLPNRGQMPGVPLGSVVETNAYFSFNGIRPVFAGELPPAVHSMIVHHVANHETILEAALNKDPGLAFGAFVNDPLVPLDLVSARQLFNEMLQNTREYLPGWEL